MVSARRRRAGSDAIASPPAPGRLHRAAAVFVSDGRITRWRHAELITGASDSPSQPIVVRGGVATIHSTVAGSPHDPAALVIAVDPQRDAVRVAPAGELDVANVGALHAQLNELREAGFQDIVLDLRELTFMDSSAVRLILKEGRLAHATGQRLSLIKGPSAVQRVLDICGLPQSLEFAGPPPAPSPARRAAARLVAHDRSSVEVALHSYFPRING